MINGVSFFGRVFPNTQVTYRKKPSLQKTGHDSFVREYDNAFNGRTYAVNKIRSFIIDEGIEYAIALSEDGNVIMENKGDEKSCSFEREKITQNAILLHGHPELLPLSSGDIAGFLCSDAKVEEAVTVNGFSRLTKKQPFKLPLNHLDLYIELEKQLCIMALEEMGIDCTLNLQEILDMFKDFLSSISNRQKENIDDKTAISQMRNFGISYNENSIEADYSKLMQLMRFQLLSNPEKYDKAHNAIIENYEELENFMRTPEGLQIRHDFVKKIADKYDLIYETNLI